MKSSYLSTSNLSFRRSGTNTSRNETSFRDAALDMSQLSQDEFKVNSNLMLIDPGVGNERNDRSSRTRKTKTYKNTRTRKTVKKRREETSLQKN